MPSLLVRSGSNWVPEKGIYVMQGGSWQRKMGYVYVNGQWVPLSTLSDGFTIYFEGYEAVPLTDSAHNGYARRGPTALEMFATGNRYYGAWARFATVNPINLTPYKEIRVRWKNDGDNYSGVESQVQILSLNGAVIRRLLRTGRFDWREDSYNISGLEGSFYLRVSAGSMADFDVSTHLFVSQWYLV